MLTIIIVGLFVVVILIEPSMFWKGDFLLECALSEVFCNVTRLVCDIIPLGL